jgi:hypothetical protein
MKPTLQAHNPTSKQGFALVVTLSLMILLTIIAVGLLSLSSVSLRASSSSLAMAEARSNARLSMLLALGQLQLMAGHDTRVTASSGVIDPNSPPVTGAWRSWEGSDHDAAGRPIIPNYGSKRSAGNPLAPPNSAGSGRFLGWLTSATAITNPGVTDFPDIANTPTANFVPMVSTASANQPGRQVFLRPTLINASRGALAWWTSGDNSKAMINTDRSPRPASIVQWQERARSNGKADATTFGLQDLDGYATGRVIASTGNLKLVNPPEDLRRMHDLTAYSRGLLTNSATGGWRRDLSLFSERFESRPGLSGALPASNLPLFTLQPGRVQNFSKAPQSGNAANPIMYPWASYRNNASGSSWEQVPPVSSWTALVDYMLQYQRVSTSNASRTAMPMFTGGTNSDRFNFVDRVRRRPQIARIHWIYSLCSDRAASPPSPSTPFRAGLMITPVLTLWNPYNVEMAFNPIQVRIQQTTPLTFRFRVGANVLQDSSLADITKTNINSYHTFIINLPAGNLRPGQSRIYGLNDPTPRRDSQASNISLTPGYRPNGGFMFFGINRGNDVFASASDQFTVERVSYDGLTQERGRDNVMKTGIGNIFDIVIDGQNSSHRMIYNVAELGGEGVAASLYPPLTAANLPSTTVGNVEGIRNQPFASAVFAYRMASPMSRDIARHRHLFTKGMLQANPLCAYAEIGFGDDSNAVNSMRGSGVYHPVNAPYDFAFQDVLGGWNDNFSIPEYERTTNSSYIVSGMASGDGLTRCVMAELPTRPLQSLADLQHFDARNNNPIPPFQFNLIGNGSANPLFAPDQVSVTTPFNNGMCNDDTYMLNHLLFDDWFVSSIAPDLRDFSSGTRRSINNVYRDHLNLTTPLPNRFYLPSNDAAVVDGREDIAQSVTNALAVTRDSRTGMFPFEFIGSKLEVEGMFNINSVSRDAWRALLRQSRRADVAYLANNGGTLTAPASNYPYPRTSIAGDLGSDSGSGQSNATFPHAAEFAGHRVLTDAQIDALADGIVNEIQRRGPFLSLSEFVNRQLSNDRQLAIASTIQRALDNLAALGNSPNNPFRVLQENSVVINALPAGTTHDYKFPEAAFGSSAFGVPGWIRQADILRPLAPILSARDDTFTIRGYGDSRERGNPNRILARAWCEVVVQRKADYVDPVDPAAVAPFSTRMTSSANLRFGRRFQIVSFRWLSESEV